MSETTGGVPMFVCGPTTGCGKLTPMERIASGWITPRNCVHCGREWRRLPSQEITLTGDLLYAPAAPRREDAPEPKTIAATACNTCGEQQNAAGYCTNKQCSRHGRRNDYLARREDAAGEPRCIFCGKQKELREMDGVWLCPGPHEAIALNQLAALRNARDYWKGQADEAIAALSTAERERDELHQQLGSAIDVARETMTEITTGRLASIGGIENTYCPQISVSRIKKLHERLVALADSYRARVPSGGEEGHA